jgi:hypothetical protein
MQCELNIHNFFTKINLFSVNIEKCKKLVVSIVQKDVLKMKILSLLKKQSKRKYCYLAFTIIFDRHLLLPNLKVEWFEQNALKKMKV